MQMIVTYLLLALSVLLFAHLIFLPLSKKRPIILKGGEASAFFTVLIALVASFLHPVIYIIALASGLFIYFTKCWIVSGVSVENIKSALDKSILATRATNVQNGNKYTLDNSMSITITNLGIKTSYIQYRSHAFSKKSELTKEIFRKFIQNYFI